MSSFTTLAAEYAEAIFSLATERDVRETLDLELADLAKVFESNPDIRNFFASPGTPKDDKIHLIQTTFQPHLDPLTVGFLLLLVRKGREMILTHILDAYQDLVDEADGKVEVQVTSATPLTEELAAKITREITRTDGGKVDLRTRVDPRLIGGLTIRVGDRLLDTSLRTRLKRLRDQTLIG